MPQLSLSFALSARFPHSWTSLLPAHLAQQGEQIMMAYVAATGQPLQMSVLGWPIKQESNLVTHYVTQPLLRLLTDTKYLNSNAKIFFFVCSTA